MYSLKRAGVGTWDIKNKRNTVHKLKFQIQTFKKR